MRNDAGHSFKSSISHQYTLDTRDDVVFPSTGEYVKVSQEVAGLGGDVSFLKTEFTAQKAVSLPNNFVLKG